MPRGVFIRLSIAISCLLVVAACSDPRDYDATKLTEDQKKELGQKLTADEGQKLMGWMMRQAFTGQQPTIGVTVRNAIKDQEQWAAKVKAEEERAALKRKEEEARAVELRKKVEAERRA